MFVSQSNSILAIVANILRLTITNTKMTSVRWLIALFWEWIDTKLHIEVGGLRSLGLDVDGGPADAI